ncbi:MAG TPA: DinB family protein [Acidimicrobiales bacterium]|jgi:hypothetical protein|nr:DinB family protein [Acidimicrobiales bacterium]
MPYEKGPDLSNRRLKDADFSGSRLHAPNFEGTKITDGWLADTDISAYIDGLRINGVEVAPLVLAELERMFPERAKLRSTDPAGLAEAWAMIEALWETTVARARRLPESAWYEQVDDEYSFVETLRHLIFATDAHFSRMVLGETRPWHPWGLAGDFLADPGELGLDPSARPSLDEVLEVRRQRMTAVRAAIANLTPEALEGICDPPPAPGHPDHSRPMLRCFHVILDEEWEHNRYANRDLAILEEPRRAAG